MESNAKQTQHNSQLPPSPKENNNRIRETEEEEQEEERIGNWVLLKEQNRRSECGSGLPGRRCRERMLISDTAACEETTSCFAPGGKTRPGHRRRGSSFSYRLLPSQTLISLSILKLDNSTFDVQVERGATLRELKASIEHLFYSLLKDEGTRISWSHVWSHFCLSYRNQKLTNDKATLPSLGIKDGDQLCFVQHLSMEKLSRKRKTKDREIFHVHRSLPSSDMRSENQTKNCSGDASLLKKSSSYNDIIYKTTLEDNISEDVQLKSCIFPWGWFSYSKLKDPGE